MWKAGRNAKAHMTLACGYWMGSSIFIRTSPQPWEEWAVTWQGRKEADSTWPAW